MVIYCHLLLANHFNKNRVCDDLILQYFSLSYEIALNAEMRSFPKEMFWSRVGLCTFVRLLARPRGLLSVVINKSAAITVTTLLTTISTIIQYGCNASLSSRDRTKCLLLSQIGNSLVGKWLSAFMQIWAGQWQQNSSINVFPSKDLWNRSYWNQC